MLLSMIKKGCRVGFFGLGRSNASLLSCLPLDKCRITIRSDEKIDREKISKEISVERVFEGKNARKRG